MIVQEPKNWLVVRLSALGDVVLTTGVLEHFAATRGHSFHFLTKPGFAPALVGLPAVEKIVLPEPGRMNGAKWYQACRDLAALYGDQWGLLDLHGTLRSRVLASVWRGPVRRYPKLSVSRRVFGLTGNERARKRLEMHNVPQRYALALADNAPSRAAVRPVIHLTEEELADGRDTIEALDADGPVCAIHPYATHAGKRWPTGHWEAFALRLHMAGWHTVVLGRHAEPMFANDPPDGVSDLTNSTDIRQTCAVLKHCAALVTNDSGPMHLGTAVGTPVVALFGPTVLAWGFAPSGERDVLMESDLPCRPCSLHGGRGCRRGEQCMRDISPDAVADAVLRRGGGS